MNRRVAERITGGWAIGVLGFVLLACSPARGESPYAVSWMRQLGTSSRDVSLSVAVDGAGNAFISGYTNGTLGGRAGSTSQEKMSGTCQEYRS